MIGLVLAAALNCGRTATQLDLDFCAAHDARAADAQEARAYRAASVRLSPDGRAQLARSEHVWRIYRNAACEYASASVEGGSMLPMLQSQCWAGTTTARTNLLRGYDNRAKQSARATGAEREEREIYGKLELLVDPNVRPLLARSEDAWHSYARVACVRAAADCPATIARDRTATLKSSWLADPFW